ncbi:MAG: ARMT1-like domain-containing protein [Pseudomonadota bacterium]
MLLRPDCIPCIMKMTLDLLRKLPITDDELRAVFRRALELPALKGDDWRTTSPLVIESIMRLLTEAAGNPDPFSAVKTEQNERMAAIYPVMSRWVQNAAAPLETAVKLAITGNAVDFMVAGGPSDLAAFIQNKLTAPLSGAAFSQFSRRLAVARSVVYFADNCGEIILDKLLIETLKAFFPQMEVSLVVKSMPALNDVTRKEALSVGMDTVASIVENGMDGPVPGTILSRCSKELNHLVDKADLIISKGGGNFETLSEERVSLPTDITFLLLSKCVPLNQYFHAGMHDLILFNHTPGDIVSIPTK